jgi:hypothetical protein
MTPNKQVSPAIRILRGERDASARATHLEAATEKYSVTTIERKQMSTTTNFKRIALVAVAALGLGVLSSVPSQATINSDVLTLSSATATQTTAETYTATSATVTLSFFGAKGDSATVTTALISAPAGSTSVPVLRLIETSSAVIDSAISMAAAPGVESVPVGTNSKRDSSTVGMNTTVGISAISSTSTTSIKYAIYMANQGRNVSAPTAGEYKVKITPAAIGVGPLVNATAQTITITVTTATSASTLVSAATSTVYMQSGATSDANVQLAAQDSTIVALKTASVTSVAKVWVAALNAASAAPSNMESITATITGAGTLGVSTPLGRSININTNTDMLNVYPDGNSGPGTITLTSAAGVLLSTKTVTFSGTVATKYAASTIASTDSSVIAVAATTKVSVLAQDASSYLVSSLVAGTDYWAFSSDTTVATVSNATTTFSATTGYSVIVTGVKAGTASIVFGNASTLAASTIKSVGVNVRVGTATPSNVTVTTDKASYAPGEKITLTVTILDAAGQAVVGATSYAGIFSSTGIVSGVTLSAGTLPGSAIADYSNTSNTKTYTLYAPLAGGPVTLSYTGGTALATANQVAKTVSFSVTDSGAAALAAVTALAVTVASLKTLITTLTNLVLKIQKKVKA